MRFSIIFFVFFLFSCAQNHSNLEIKKPFVAKGFAYIYNEEDYDDKIIKKKMDQNTLQIAHNKLKAGTLIKITNLNTNDSIVLKNTKKIKFPDFYKILITKPVAKQINLKFDLPIVEVIEIKKNKSFIAKKTKIFKEEEKIYNNAPIETVKIDNISKSKKIKKKDVKQKFYITVADFYSKSSAHILKKRITQELPNFDSKKLFIKVKKSNKTSLISGPYKSINLMKNDYIQLKNFGFEELDIDINE
tara:strand:- start:7258 stop:7995 length:738 start_codon:yes stop_codon:yes gene_type:complete